MRGLRLAILVLLAACSSSRGAATGSARAVASGAGRVAVPVTKVTDGDTIHVTYQGRDERVRLIGIDTPEVPWYGGLGECFGIEAAEYVQRRLSGGSVGLAFDVDLRDPYQRLLAYVYVGPELLNLTLLQEGYAHADPVPPDTARADEFAAAEDDARSAGRGLWAACPAG